MDIGILDLLISPNEGSLGVLFANPEDVVGISSMPGPLQALCLHHFFCLVIVSLLRFGFNVTSLEFLVVVSSLVILVNISSLVIPVVVSPLWVSLSISPPWS